MPTNETKTRAALPAQIEGKFDMTVEANYFGGVISSDFQTETIELFPQAETIAISSDVNGEGFGFDLTPRDALEFSKKLMAMCAAYTEDIGDCDTCGELYPTEELHKVWSSHGEVTACTRCVESGSL